MKIIKAGDDEMARWWIGRKVTCPKCHQVGELEEVDARRAGFLRADFDTVLIDCTCCDHRLILSRMDHVSHHEKTT